MTPPHAHDQYLTKGQMQKFIDGLKVYENSILSMEKDNISGAQLAYTGAIRQTLRAIINSWEDSK